MKKITVPFLLSFLLVSCGDDSSNAADNSGKNKTVSGVAQLGAFEKGSTLSVYELNENLKQTGFNIESTVLNDQGEYSINLKDLESQYALLKADGYYRNAITGEKSSEKAILYALADLDERSKVNINILTHLSHKRAIYLVSEKDMSFAEAKKQAEAEVLKSFGIDEEFDDAETLNIIGNDNQSIALLAMSILMQSERSEAELNDRLTQYPTDIEGDGIWDDEKTIAKIADWAYKVYYYSAFGTIKDYVKTWNSAVVFATFEKYVNSFWHHHYGLGTCYDDRLNEVLKNELFTSDFQDKYFICRPGGKWKEASEKEIEKFFDFGKDVIDGMTRTVQITQYYTSCLVYDGDSWRKGNDSECKYGFGGCTKKREGITKVTSTGKYTCEKQNWVYSYIEQTTDESFFTQSGTIDLDTIGWKDTTDGTIRKGNVTDIIYIFDKDAWRVANIPEATLGKCNKENLDSAGYAEYRDGQTNLNPLYSICNYNNQLYDRYERCPSSTYDSKYSKYYICRYDVYEDSKDTIYAWLPISKRCHLDKYDIKGEKFIRWKAGKEGEIRWGNMQKDDSEKQDYFSDKCEQNCYEFKNGQWTQTAITKCMGLGTCNEKLMGTIKEGPVVHSEIQCNSPDYDMTVNRCKNILVKIDTLKKINYVCRGNIEYKHDEQCDFIKYLYEPCDYNPTPVTKNWSVATNTDLKTSQLKCTRDGALVSTKTDPDDIYVCDKNGFRDATKAEKMIGLGCTYFTRDKQYHPKGLKSYFICEDFGNYYTSNYIWYIPAGGNDGTMTDPRDSTVYKTTGIGTKTWMMESLNYADSSNYPSMLERNKCEDDDLDNCKKDGRLYTWSAIIDSVYWASKGKTCGNTKDNDKKCDLPDLVQGICPKGWHVPSIQEWDDLNLWMNMFFTDGYDHYGFLRRDYREYFFWTSTDSTGSTANSNLLDLSKPDHSSDIRSIVSKTKDTPLAVRCVKDD